MIQDERREQGPLTDLRRYFGNDETVTLKTRSIALGLLGLAVAFQLFVSPMMIDCDQRAPTAYGRSKTDTVMVLQFDFMGSGPPSWGQVLEYVDTLQYSGMEAFCDDWKKGHARSLSLHPGEALEDPIRVWDRAWDYAYIWARMTLLVDHNHKILELESRVSFYPYWIQTQNFKLDVVAWDVDPGFEQVYRRVNTQDRNTVRFVTGGLEDASDPSLLSPDSYDVVYLVNRLPETRHYVEAGGRALRLLHSGGHFLVCWTMYLESNGGEYGQFSLNESEELLGSFRSLFVESTSSAIPMRSVVEAGEYVTPGYVGAAYPDDPTRASRWHWSRDEDATLTCHTFRKV